MALVFSDMPDDMRHMLTENFTSCFEGVNPRLYEMDSASQGADYSFPAWHFSWYNRHGTRVGSFDTQFKHVNCSLTTGQGHYFPPNAHPYLTRKANNEKTNYHQLLPYTSSDMTNFHAQYLNLQAVMGDVFDWISAQVGVDIMTITTNI